MSSTAELFVTSIRERSSREEEHLVSKTLNRWIPPLVHMGSAIRK